MNRRQILLEMPIRNKVSTLGQIWLMMDLVSIDWTGLQQLSGVTAESGKKQRISSGSFLGHLSMACRINKPTPISIAPPYSGQAVRILQANNICHSLAKKRKGLNLCKRGPILRTITSPWICQFSKFTKSISWEVLILKILIELKRQKKNAWIVASR